MDSQSSQQTTSTIASTQPQSKYAAAAGGQCQTTVSFQTSPGASPPPAIVAVQSSGGYAFIPPAITGYQHDHQQQMQQFWTSQMQEVQQVTDFRVHQLPLARIKKIMKADEDVGMIAAEAPIVFAKACEMFILELTVRAWIHTEENKRRTLQKNDIAAAITRTDIFHFLVDIVPRDELKDESLGIPRAVVQVGAPADALSFGGMYYVAPGGCAVPQQCPGVVPMMAQPPPPMMASPGIIVGRPALAVDPTMCRPPIPFTTSPVAQGLQQPTQDSQIEAKDRSS